MVVTFTLPLKAFSINQMSARDQRFKTAEYKDYATAALYHLSEIKELHELALEHKERGGTFCVHMTAYYPEHIFYSKNGSVSAKTIDCSNFEKPLLDLIFGHTMDVNDKFVTELHSKKAPGSTWSLSVRIELLG